MTAPTVERSPVEVLVMAGGEGRRLGALTARTPKPMLPVADRPALQHIVERLRDQGVSHVYLSVRHMSSVIMDYFGDGRWLGLDIDYLVEEQPLGTAGAIGLLPPLAGPLLVLNGDVLAEIPIAAMVRHHVLHRAAMTVAHVEERLDVPYGVLRCAGADVVRLQEKPALVLTVIAGVYLLSAEVAEGVRPESPLDMPRLIEMVLGTARVVGFPLPGHWLDIGTPDTYARADQVVAGLDPLPEVGVRR